MIPSLLRVFRVFVVQLPPMFRVILPASHTTGW